MDAKTLKGIAVVAIQDGEKVGSVSQVRFNLERRGIAVFEVGSGGLFSSSTQYLPMDNVASIGTDAIMIQDRGALLGSNAGTQVQQYPTLDDLTSLRVVTDGGTYLGTLATVDVDPGNGLMTALEIEKPGIAGAFRAHIDVPIAQVISIGRDVAVVPNQYAEQPGAGSAQTEEPVRERERERERDQGLNTEVPPTS